MALHTHVILQAHAEELNVTGAEKLFSGAVLLSLFSEWAWFYSRGYSLPLVLIAQQLILKCCALIGSMYVSNKLMLVKRNWLSRIISGFVIAVTLVQSQVALVGVFLIQPDPNGVYHAWNAIRAEVYIWVWLALAIWCVWLLEKKGRSAGQPPLAKI